CRRRTPGGPPPHWPAPEARRAAYPPRSCRAVALLQAGPAPDVLFLDIHLADGLSFELFEQVEITCPVIFTTAYDQYALRAFKVNSVDYLLKPIDEEELVAAIAKLRQRL
nr:hypothetical protein [Tanacetum cinerariifolium]